MARILVVDDEEMDRMLERSILESAGHELVYAADGEAALTVCRESLVDLVVTDLGNFFRGTDNTAGDDVRVTIQIFGRTVQDQIETDFERPEVDR